MYLIHIAGNVNETWYRYELPTYMAQFYCYNVGPIVLPIYFTDSFIEDGGTA